MITFLIFIFVIIIGVCVTLSAESKSSSPNINEPIKPPPEKYDLNSTMKVNGMEIHLSDYELEQLKQKQLDDEKEQLKKDKEVLLDRIKMSMYGTNDLVQKKVLEEMMKINIESRSDYERVEYLYNDGNLRSNEEVELFNKIEATKAERENYDKERHKTNVFAFLIPFVIGTMLGVAIMDDWFFGLPVGLVIGGFAGLIGMAIGHSINIKKAQEYCIPDNDPRVIDEKQKQTVTVVSTGLAGASVIYNTKKAVKGVTNVDSWKELN